MIGEHLPVEADQGACAFACAFVRVLFSAGGAICAYTESWLNTQAIYGNEGDRDFIILSCLPFRFSVSCLGLQAPCLARAVYYFETTPSFSEKMSTYF
ncbi:hypothetical protein ACE1TI_05760 [Alteribacillus sp. JSM 102045]|uniref:hypothetical protein n=1 Tax=Alteribacillus sp. JSM 102045 TaxID=1562101 RepID=UPI0035C22678